MNRFYMKARTLVLKTALGKNLRYWMQQRSYKIENAEKTARAAYGDELSAEELKAVVADMMTEAKK